MHESAHKGEGHRTILRPGFEPANYLYERAAISVLFVLQHCGCLNSNTGHYLATRDPYVARANNW
jgi:hypothetical protein